jgi:DNA mismatch repair protein MSH6
LGSILTSKSKQAKKVVSYAESDDEDDEDAFDPAGINTQKRKLHRKAKVVESEDDDEDVFIGGLDGAADDDDGKVPSVHVQNIILILGRRDGRFCCR